MRATANSLPAEDDPIWGELALTAVLANRARQESIARTVERSVAGAMERSLDYRRLSETQWLFAELALPHIERGWVDSAQAASDLSHQLESLAVLRSDPDFRPDAAPRVLTHPDIRGSLGAERVVEPLNRARAAVTLVDESAGRIRRRMPVPESMIMPVVANAAAGAASRMALDGGRTVAADDAASSALCIGFQRVTDSDPCYFCGLLAANGPVYKSAKSFSNRNSKTGERFKANKIFGGNEPDLIAKVHNHCRCTLAPVYEGFEIDDPIGDFAADLWGQVALDGFGGREGLAEFRRRYENHPDLPFRQPRVSGGVASAFSRTGNAAASTFIRSLAA